MPLRQRVVLAVGIALVAICLSPFLVGDGVRLWIWWKARQEKLTVKIDKIDAPFLQPITFHGVRITSSPDAIFRTELRATEITIGLNFKRIILRTRGRLLRSISGSDLHVEIHQNANGAAFPTSTWTTWQSLLPENFNLQRLELRVENGPVVALLRGSAMNGSEIESGHFSADEFTIASPVVRQTFSRLRGATRWQDNHLTLSGLSLARGLDLQSIAVDLSHLSKQRLGLDFDLDAFGGKLRGNVGDEWRAQDSGWDIAASASDISLGQTAEAIGFADRLAGRLHAGKLTFRGNIGDPLHATVSLWAELAAPAWLDREADVVMIGASLYNRQIDLQQLYIRQKKNQLTLTGQGSMPETSFDLSNADFRGTISASVKNLDDFAALFGAKRGSFGGEIAINGTMNARDRKLDGQLSIDGSSLVVFKTPIDALSARLDLKSTMVEFEEVNLKRGQDSLRVAGKIDMSAAHNHAGTIEVAAHNLSDYFAKPLFTGALNARFTLAGKTANADAMQMSDHGLTTSVRAAIDFSDITKIAITLTPLAPLFDLSAPNASDCIGSIQFAPFYKPKVPPPSIDKIDMLADLAGGIQTFKITATSGEKDYRVLCDEPTNRALLLGVSGEKKP